MLRNSFKIKDLSKLVKKIYLQNYIKILAINISLKLKRTQIKIETKPFR